MYLIPISSPSILPEVPSPPILQNLKELKPRTHHQPLMSKNPNWEKEREGRDRKENRESYIHTHTHTGLPAPKIIVAAASACCITTATVPLLFATTVDQAARASHHWRVAAVPHRPPSALVEASSRAVTMSIVVLASSHDCRPPRRSAIGASIFPHRIEPAST